MRRLMSAVVILGGRNLNEPKTACGNGYT